MTSTLSCAAVLAIALAPGPARADTTVLSQLPEKPARYARAEGKIPVGFSADKNRLFIEPGPSACLIYDPPKYWIDGDATVPDRSPSLGVAAGESFGVERFVTRGDTAELERIIVEAGPESLTPTARSRIPLHPVAAIDGLTVYAYRWAQQVFLVARTTGMPMVRPDGGTMFETDECSIALTMMRVRNGSSQVAQIQGTVPRTGKRYLVDASVSQTGRDPEPLLSVTARLLDR